MTARLQALFKTLALVLSLSIVLSACKTATIEVTRVKIMERRVIEKVLVTVEVTRIHEVVITPSSTLVPVAPSADDPNLLLTPSPALSTPTPVVVGPAPVSTATSSSARAVGEDMLGAIRNLEQTLLSLVQALNSDPLPGARIIELYAVVRSAPTFTVPENEPALQAYYALYREQVDYVLGQGNDLHAHLVQIETGEATQTEVSPTHLSLAQDAVSSGTSALQNLMRDLDAYLTALP